MNPDGDGLVVLRAGLEFPLLHRLDGFFVQAVDAIERSADAHIADLPIVEHHRCKLDGWAVWI
jgi:hypothetical protein